MFVWDAPPLPLDFRKKNKHTKSIVHIIEEFFDRKTIFLTKLGRPKMYKFYSENKATKIIQ